MTIATTTDRNSPIVTECNQLFLDTLGFSRHEVVGHPLADFLTLESGAALLQAGGCQPSFNRELVVEEGQLVAKDGSLLETMLRVVPLRDSGGRVSGAVAICFDRAEGKRTERASVEPELQYRQLFEHANDAILIFEPESEIILEANRKACELYGLGRDRLIGMSLKRFTKDVRRGEQQIQELRRDGTYKNFETVHLKEDGTEVHILASSSVIEFRGSDAILSINRDMTERKILEEQLWQAQKMEAVGRLAGGVAHDFNNLLHVILGYSELLLVSLSAEALKKQVREIKKAGERAASLVRRLLSFSRQQVFAPGVLDIGAVVDNLEPLLRSQMGENIEFVKRWCTGSGRVQADPAQMEQIILNLVVNAGDAMPNGGRLTIETQDVELDHAFVRGHPGARTGSYVLLKVTDNGTGMDAETKKHVFEPFFSTKEQGKRTGLGLSIVYGIVRQNRGYIWLDSELGRGTSFSVYLPRAMEAPEAIEPARVRDAATVGMKTVLLVEDEPSLRSLLRDVLQAWSYRVLEAEDGVEAMRIAERYRDRIDLLMSDVVLPRMNGRELFIRLSALRPELRVLYMSGYAPDTIPQHNGCDRESILLQKPFTLEALSHKVHEVLNA